MIYSIMFHDELICSFNRVNGKAKIIQPQKMPFDLYIEEKDDFDDCVNNKTNFNAWCANRILSIDRKYAKEILNYYGFSQRMTDVERADIALFIRCLSLNDGFWVRKQEEELTWKDVNLFENSLSGVVLEVALLGKNLTLTKRELLSPDLSTDGTAPKAWQRRDKEFFLLKGDVDGSALREVEASQILNEIGIPSVIYRHSRFLDQNVSECLCFTSEQKNLARAGDVSVWCMNHGTDISEYVSKYETMYELMNIADYLIGNNDRHRDNWGFIYNNELQITNISPLMDFDHAFLAGELEGCLPEQLMGKIVTQEKYAQSVISKHFDDLNFDIDYGKYQYGDFVEERVNGLVSSLGNAKG